MKNDKDIPTTKWNRYLKKYNKEFVLHTDDVGCWQIKLRKKIGFIQPYSIVNKELVAILNFKSNTGKSYWLKNLSNVEKIDLEITQDGESELCIKFKEKDIYALETLFLYYRRQRKQ